MASFADSPETALLADGLSQRRIPGLDGLRAVAVLTIVALHLKVLPGHLALLIFFVLSGFLITWLLLREEDRHGRVSLRAFYVRRTLRIFPAFYAVWLLVVIAFPFHRDMPDGHAWSAFFYVSNYYQGLFGVPPSTIHHFWSLGIEEQFYLLWPLGFLALGHVGWSRSRALIVTIGVVWALRLTHVLAWHNEVYAYHAFETRADHILVGCLLAVWVHGGRLPRPIRGLLSSPWAVFVPILVLFATVVGAAMGGHRFRLVVGFIVQPVAAGLLLLQCIAWFRHPLFRWLESRPVRWIGERSYGIYLLHIFVIWVVARRDFALTPGQQLAASLVGSVLAAQVLYFLVERPFLRLKARWSRIG